MHAEQQKWHPIQFAVNTFCYLLCYEINWGPYLNTIKMDCLWDSGGGAVKYDIVHMPTKHFQKNEFGSLPKTDP